MNTYNPFSITESPKVGVFRGLASPAVGTVLVVDRDGHPPIALEGATDRLTGGEVRFGKIRTLYAVDITEHQLYFEDTLPCSDDAGGFRAKVTFTCKVREKAAAEVVRRGIHDAAALLVPLLTETLRRSCGKFSAEQADDAEQAGLAAIRSMESQAGHDSTFVISAIHLVLAPDEAAANYVGQLKKIQRDGELQKSSARLQAEKAELEAELARATREFDHKRLEHEQERVKLEGQLAAQREELEAARANAQDLARNRGANEVERQALTFEQERQALQAKLDHEQLLLDLQSAKLQAKLERRRQKARLTLEREHLAQLRELLQQGEFGQLALQLLKNPASINSVVGQLAAQRDANSSRQLHALQLMLENDGLQAWEITDQAKKVLHNLLETWSASGPPLGLAAGTPPLADAPSEDVPAAPVEQVTVVESVADEESYPGDREPASRPAHAAEPD